MSDDTTHGATGEAGEVGALPRLLWFLLGAGAGAAAMALLDPAAGRRRRHQLQDQLGARSREAVDEAAARVDYATGQARGAAVEAAKSAVPDGLRDPEDPKTLRQRIRSEVLGHVDGTDDVVVVVHDEGDVVVKGAVPSAQTEEEILTGIRRVAGVDEVTSELHVAGADA